jgi:hypothetical protein
MRQTKSTEMAHTFIDLLSLMDDHGCAFDVCLPFLEQFIGIMQDELCEAIDGAHSQPSFINLALALVQGVMHFLHTGDAIAAVKGDDILKENLVSIFEHIDSCTDYSVQMKLAYVYHKLLSADVNNPELRQLVEAAPAHLQSFC